MRQLLTLYRRLRIYWTYHSTELHAESLTDDGKKLTFTYRADVAPEENSWTQVPVLLIFVDRQYERESVELKCNWQGLSTARTRSIILTRIQQERDDQTVVSFVAQPGLEPKNNQAVEVNNNAVTQPLTERQSLRALCKQLREKYGTEERINNLLCIFPPYNKSLHLLY